MRMLCVARHRFLSEHLCRYFEALGMDAVPCVGLADCIVDVVETGRTLDENGLEAIEEVATSSARFVVNRASYHARRAEVTALLGKLSR